MTNIEEIVNEHEINKLLEETCTSTREQVFEILQRAAEKNGISLKDAGFLLNINDKELIEKMFSVSGKIKNEIYGERLVFFAPLYISNFCVNDCDYCGFHCRNPAPRKKLSQEEVAEQVKILEDMGHKRLLLEFGEHPIENDINYVVDVIKKVYSTKSGKGEIRRVNVNIAATSVGDYKKLKEAGIGTYQLFQETYHRETYNKLHSGPKANYERQLFAHDRAIEAGIDDVGIGVLFGLYDYKFEVLALIAHSEYLEKKYGTGPHTISVPRFQPANTVSLNQQYKVSEEELLKIVSILRMAVPYTGMIMSTRERPEIRQKAFEIGISQTSAASKTAPGGYGKEEELHQFFLQDRRSLDGVTNAVLEQGLLPSFCTACYRTGRTGENIMKLLKTGDINTLCRPNAILTFQEYLEDYASADVRKKGLGVISKYMAQIPNDALRKETESRLKRIAKGERDLYF